MPEKKDSEAELQLAKQQIATMQAAATASSEGESPSIQSGIIPRPAEKRYSILKKSGLKRPKYFALRVCINKSINAALFSPSLTF